MISLRSILILLLVSCGGGGNNSPTLLVETSLNQQPFSYNPPSGKSRDNCVAKSDSANWIDDFTIPELDKSKWSYDEGCNNNGGGCNGNNELQNYTSDAVSYTHLTLPTSVTV